MSFFNSFLKFTFLPLLLLLLIYIWHSKKMKFWKKRGFPFINPSPIVGNYLDVFLARTSIPDMYKKFCSQMSDEKYFGIYVTTKPVLIIKDPEVVMNVLVKDFHYFHDRGFHIDPNDVLGNNLFFSRNPKWKQQRIKIAPVFSSSKLKAMFGLIHQCCEGLLEYMETIGENTSTKSLSGAVFSDITCKTLCGIELNSVRNMNEQHQRMQNLAFAPSFRQKIKNLIDLVSPEVGKKIYLFPRALYDYFSNLVLGTAQMRKEKNIRRNDFLQLMVDIYEQDQALPSTQRILQKNDLIGVIFVFLIAGYETSVSTTSLTLNELAHNKETQDQIRRQLKDIYEKNGNQIDYDLLKKMTLLEQAISETLRLHPLVNALFRECMEDYVIPGTNHIIAKNTTIHIASYAIQRDPKYWSDPDKFDFRRFSEENISKIVPGSYVPFGDGPRICIGKRVAFLQLKMVLATILLNYQVSPCEGSTKFPSIQRDSMLGTPKEDLLLKFTKII